MYFDVEYAKRCSQSITSFEEGLYFAFEVENNKINDLERKQVMLISEFEAFAKSAIAETILTVNELKNIDSLLFNIRLFIQPQKCKVFIQTQKCKDLNKRTQSNNYPKDFGHEGSSPSSYNPHNF